MSFSGPLTPSFTFYLYHICKNSHVICTIRCVSIAVVSKKTNFIQNIEEYTIYSCYKLKWCICGELVLSFKRESLTSFCGKEAKSKQQTKSQKLDFQNIHTLNTIESIFYSLSLLSTDVLYDEQTLPATSRTGT